MVSAVMDSLEFIDQDYVVVSGPSMDVSSSSASASRPSHSPYKSECPPKAYVSMASTSSPPMPIIGKATTDIGHIGSLESQNSALGTSQGSMEIGDVLEQPSTHCTTRIKSLQHCASAIKDLLNEKVSDGIPIYATKPVHFPLSLQTYRKLKVHHVERSEYLLKLFPSSSLTTQPLS